MGDATRAGCGGVASSGGRDARILWFDGLVVERRNARLCYVLEQLQAGAAWGERALDPVLNSPWFIYGAAQCGKTHLARALTALWQRRCPQRPAIYVGAIEFASQFADAVDNRHLDAWARKIMGLGLLVIDDLHCLPARDDVQRELIRLLDQFSARGSLLVLTSCLELVELAHLPAGLLSRLEGGLLLELVTPGPEGRLALVERLASEAKLSLEPQAASALARHPWPSLAELQEAVESLAGMAGPAENGRPAAQGASERSDGRGPTTEAELRQRLGLRPVRAATPIRQIAQRTARHFGLSLAELRGPSRRRAVATARGVAAYLARQLTGCSLESIGEFLGGRDHTTILHACQQTEQRARRDATVREAIKQLTRVLSRW